MANKWRGIIFFIGLLLTLAMVEAGFRLADDSAIERVAEFAGFRILHSRLDIVDDGPAEMRDALLYLTYLDSLAREDRALPRGGKIALGDRRTIANIILEESGADAKVLRMWGYDPTLPEVRTNLTVLFRGLHRMKKLQLAREAVSLYDEIREKQIAPGYVVFGQIPPGEEVAQVNFCAVFTSVNWFDPGISSLVYFLADDAGNPLSRRMIHGRLDRIPPFDYYGCGVPDDRLADIYHEYIRLGTWANRKMLY
jgi:hypothetical protein